MVIVLKPIEKLVHTVHMTYCTLCVALFDVLTTLPGYVAQSVTCVIADPGVASLILAWSLTFMEIDRELIGMSILLPSPDSRWAVVSYKRKYVHEVLVNC